MTHCKEMERLWAKVTALGGRRLKTIVEAIIESNMPVPMEEWMANKLRNVGSKTMSDLRQLGFVIESPLAGLTVRARNCLFDAGIETKEQARQAIVDGWEISLVRNCGMETKKEIYKWVGLPEPTKPNRVRICPHCGKPATGSATEVHQ